MNRTDLALEIAQKSNIVGGVEITNGNLYGVDFSRIDLSECGSEKIGKPPGLYLTLFCDGICEQNEIIALSDIMSPLVPKSGKILVAGLGNENITPDCLGVRTISRTAATAHLSHLPDFEALSMREVYVIETGVLAQTGVESALQLKYLCDGIKPCAVIAVDSLACMEIEKLGKTIQITDSGIAPGSGVNNSRNEISLGTLGVPVIAVGVPTVADTQSVLGGSTNELSHTMIVARDIDIVINRFAKIISKALNKVLNPNLGESEIEQLLF